MPRQNKKTREDIPSSPQRKISPVENDKYSMKSGGSSPILELGEVKTNYAISARFLPGKKKKASTWSYRNCNTKSYRRAQVGEDAPATIAVRTGKKRAYEEEECGPSGDFGSEMQKMLEVFGADISKTISDKRKRLEQFTQSSLRTNAKKVEQIMKGQQSERSKLQEEYCRQAESVFAQWDTDIEKMKEQEEKITNLFKQQQKVFQQSRVIMGQRLKTVRQLNEQFLKGLDDLERSHVSQQSSVQSELKKEMALLQKRILMDMQQREVTNMRKSLQTMLF